MLLSLIRPALAPGRRTQLLAAVATVAVLALAPHAALAGVTMPWDAPLCTIQTSLTGVPARVCCVLLFMGVGFALSQGGEDMSPMTRRILVGVLAASIILGANSFLSLFGKTDSCASAYNGLVPHMASVSHGGRA